MSNTGSESQSVGTSSRGKDAIIAAIATVLAAVVVAAGTIIAGGRREKTSLENQVTTLQGQIDAKTRETKTLAATVVNLQQQVSKLEASAASIQGRESQTATTGTAGASPATSTEPSPPVTRSADEADINIGFQRCMRRAGKVICQFVVTNNGGERGVQINADSWAARSRAVDDQGKQQLAEGAEIAGVEAGRPSVTLPSKISVPAQIRFIGLPADVRSFKVLDIVFETSGTYKVSFRDVTISEGE